MQTCSASAARGDPAGSVAGAIATGERIAAVRARAARIARLEKGGGPHFAAVPAAILGEPPSADPANDLWVATCAALVADLEVGLN